MPNPFKIFFLNFEKFLTIKISTDESSHFEGYFRVFFKIKFVFVRLNINLLPQN